MERKCGSYWPSYLQIPFSSKQLEDPTASHMQIDVLVSFRISGRRKHARRLSVELFSFSRTEQHVGEAVRKSGIPREAKCDITKLSSMLLSFVRAPETSSL